MFIDYIMSAETFSDSLNYPNVKRRSVASRSFRVKIPSSNATTFTPGQTINIELPGNLMGQYFNFNQMYLKFGVKASHATNTAGLVWDRAGAVSAIKRVQISTAGSAICDLNNYNVLYTALLDTDASDEWKTSTGQILTGTTGGLSGEVVRSSVTGGEVRTYCVPIVLNPLANTTPHRLIPAFSMSSIQMKITLDDLQHMGITSADLAVTFSEVEVVCMMTELSPSAQAQVEQMTGGQYNILANSYMNSGASMSQGVSSVTANLGFSVSSLERILLVQRNSASVNSSVAYSLGNRTPNALQEFQYLINSENYPQRPILVSDVGAEAYAELLIADHSLTDFRKGTKLGAGAMTSTNNQLFQNGYDSSKLGWESSQAASFRGDTYNAGVVADQVGTQRGETSTQIAFVAGNVPVPAVVSNIGTFLGACEFETGLSDGKSQNIYSGISTIASTVQYKGTYGAATSLACNLDFFAEYSVMLSLDTRGTGVWNVSV